MKYYSIAVILLCVCLTGCDQSTNPSNEQTLIGTWQEEFIWHSPFQNVIAEDTTMTKISIITFQENTFSLKTTPPHRIFVNADSTMDIMYSDTAYNGRFDIQGDTIRLFYDIELGHHSAYLRYHIQNDYLHLEQVPIIILGKPAYLLTGIPWAASSKKHSGVFSKLR